MKLSIRMKIFLPVVILLIGFPLATWATLRYSLEVHMNFNARRDLEAMVRTVDGVLEKPEDGEEGDTVLSRLRDAVQTGADVYKRQEERPRRFPAPTSGSQELHKIWTH